jgi:hypothetical protein
MGLVIAFLVILPLGWLVMGVETVARALGLTGRPIVSDAEIERVMVLLAPEVEQVTLESLDRLEREDHWARDAACAAVKILRCEGQQPWRYPAGEAIGRVVRRLDPDAAMLGLHDSVNDARVQDWLAVVQTLDHACIAEWGRDRLPDPLVAELRAPWERVICVPGHAQRVVAAEAFTT